MKTITLIIRLLVGMLFIFSGFVKFNDPLGFSYKMKEYFEVFADDLKGDADSLQIVFANKTGGEVSFEKAIFPSQTQAKIWAVNYVDDEPMVIGTDTFKIHIVQISVGGELVYDEMFPFSDIHEEEISINWLVGKGTGSKNIVVSSQKTNEDEFNIEFSEYLSTQPLFSRFFEALIPHAMWIGLFVCIFELMLGFALLIGWNPFFTTFTMLLMIVFFTFLTGYSAVFDKVTDCGCFGDAIKLTPWESFWKDIVLSVLIIALFIRHKTIKPLFSSKFGFKAFMLSGALSLTYSIYAITYLPPINFLNFANGNNIYERTLIPEGQPKTDSVEFIYFYKNEATGEITKFMVNDAPVGQEGWTFHDREEKVIRKAYKPSLDNFNNIMHPLYGDVSDSILQHSDYQLIVVSEELSEAKPADLKKLTALLQDWHKQTGKKIWFITGSTPDSKMEYESTYLPPVPLLSADKTFVKSIIRSNPGIILLKGPVVIKNWPSRKLPSFKRLQKRLK